MTRRIPAPPPHPDGRRPEPREDEPLPDDDEEGTEDFDESELDDDLDWADDQSWPDDEPLPELWQEDGPVLADDTGDLDAPDDDPDDLPADDDLTDEPSLDDDIDLDEPEDVLPWRTAVILPDLGIMLPAVLNPTLDESRWVGAPLDHEGEVVLLVGTHRVQAVLRPVAGDHPHLELGRDVLRGRIAVSSEDPTRDGAPEP